MDAFFPSLKCEARAARMCLYVSDCVFVYRVALQDTTPRLYKSKGKDLAAGMHQGALLRLKTSSEHLPFSLFGLLPRVPHSSCTCVGANFVKIWS